jgi:hypothetical protein
MAVAALTAFTSVAAVPVKQGSVAHLTYLGLLLVPVLMVFASMAVIASRRKARAPLLWRESRQSAFVAAFAAPLYLGFLIWAGWNGISAGALTAATLFLTGLFLLMGVLGDPRRRHMLGWAIATLLIGACAPLGSYGTAGILAGGWLFLGGLSTAGILAWQLHQEGGPHADRL